MELYINVIIGFFMFVIGTLFGSFFSLATYRLPRHQDIVVKRSYCPTCKHRLEFFDLIPILSYVLSRGKCRYCKEKISSRYLLLEFTNGIVFLFLYLLLGYTLKLLFVCLVYATVFVFVGSYIMKTKMTDDEKKYIKLNTKKGVYITEIVIAMLVFTVLLISSYVISRNYNKKSINTIARSVAVSLAVKNAEASKATKYDMLESYTLDTIQNGINYNINVEVIPFNDIDVYYKDIVKKIKISIKYNIDGNQYEYNMSTLKGKVTYNE